MKHYKNRNFVIDFSKLKLDKKIKFKNAVNQLDKEILSSFQKLKFKKETIVAVSGGMDSTSSSYYLKKLNYNLPSFTVKYDVSTNLMNLTEQNK